jgi:hypothetical protein
VNFPDLKTLALLFIGGGLITLAGFGVVSIPTSSPTSTNPTPSYRKVQIQVLGEDRKPLSDVVVNITSGSPAKEGRTNSSGYGQFQILSQSKRVSITLQKKGFITRSEEIDLEGDAGQTGQYYMVAVEPERPKKKEPGATEKQAMSAKPSPSFENVMPKKSPSTKPLPPPVKKPINLGSLNSFRVKIFFLDTRQDLQEIAVSIEKELKNRGLRNVGRRPLPLNKVRNVNVCPWYTIRYEPSESTAARNLKSLLEQVAPNQNFSLFLLDPNRPDPTPGSMSIFLDDSGAFTEAYSNDEEDYKEFIKKDCSNESKRASS